MRTLLYILLCLSICMTTDGGIVGSQYVGKTSAPPADDFSDITFWWRCEGTTLDGDLDYTAGDGVATLNDGATISDAAEKYGTNGLLIDNGWENCEFSVSSDDIISSAKGRIGFWLANASLGNGGIIFSINYSAGFYVYSDSDGSLHTYWNDGVNERNQAGNAGDVTTGSFQWFEVEWDTTANTIKVWVDNSLKVSETEAIDAFSETGLYFGHTSGSGGALAIDNIMISSLSKARNFYTDLSGATALKDLTASPK